MVDPGEYPSFWFHENLIAFSKEIARQDTEAFF